MFRFLLISLSIIVSTGLSAQTTLPDIPSILEQHKKALALSPQDLAAYVVSSAYTSEHINITHIYLEQRYLDIPVFNGILNLNVSGDKLVSFGNRWIPELLAKAPSNIPNLTAAIALEKAALEIGYVFQNPTELRREQNKLGQDTKIVFAEGNLAENEIVAELTWVKGEQKDVLLCWKVFIDEIEKENIWVIMIDAHSGAFVRKDNMVIHCDFGAPEDHSHVNYASKNLSSLFAPPPTPDSSYNVFAMPVESPNHGARTIQTRPWLAAGAGNPAITKGWHNNGTTNYTSTRGNNVDAYEDMDNNNLPGLRPDTFNLRFDYPFTSTANATINLKSCITNLFYWNNIIHDVMYQYGFDEVSGNFQNNNLGRGGLGNDYVKAEAQDGGGTNNANFSTPVDGGSGRMQMYLWSPYFDGSPLTINTPPSIAGSMFAVESAFSTNNKIFDIGLTAGDFVLVNDAIGGTHQACGVIANAASLPGKIAVIDRGGCDFVTKVKAVQLLGAIGAIVINNVPGDPFAMGGTDNLIEIPAVMIGIADGDTLKSVMISNTVNGSLDGIRPDGDFDSGIITHEYGHGISTRLTGGPANNSCLFNAEQMGEGWSDFFGLMLTTDWLNATSTDIRGIGTYALGQPPDSTGIRTYPYTIDQDINPFTYADVGNSSSSHYIGSVWCTILWDMAWSIIEMEGVDPDIYHGTGGNNIALQLVMDGLKLQPCSPGFVDGRDAILLADKLNYGGAHYCAIWNAFAGRGLGTGASQGSSNSNTDGVESFTVPASIRIESSTNAPLGAGEGQDVTFNVKTICECEGKSDLTIEDVLSTDLTYIPGTGGTLNGNKVQFSADTLAPMDSLEFTYHAFIKPCSAVATALLNNDNAETPDQYQSIKLAGDPNPAKVWTKSTTQFVSPTRSWYAQDFSELADYVLRLNSAVAVTPGIIEIAFNHRYATEATYDGGTVEYSLNGGTTWLDAGPYFVENGYPSFINKNGVIINAFSGNSDTQYGITGFLHSSIHIPVVSNASMLVRFRMYCDGGVAGGGINGWYLDDIQINHVSGAANKARALAESILIDSLFHSQRTTIFTGNKVYVDPTATGSRSGTSWSNAMHYLPNAMDLAGCRTADSVFVAQGTFLPNLTNNRTLSFKIPNNTLVFGGFPPGGSSFAMRNPVTYPTILSGDIGTVNNNSDNVYHVIKVDSAQVGLLLDGVTLTKGNANGTGDNSQGAAVFCLGNLILQNVTVTSNTGIANGQLFRIRSASAHFGLTGCNIYGTPDGFTKLLISNAAELNLLGNNQVYRE